MGDDKKQDLDNASKTRGPQEGKDDKASKTSRTLHLAKRQTATTEKRFSLGLRIAVAWHLGRAEDG